MLIGDPIALATSAMPLNITHLEPTDDVPAVVARLLEDGHELFIGIAVPDRLRRELIRGVDDAAADLVGGIGGKLCRSKRA